MDVITVVDARMGRGKSSAAIRYMNEHRDTKRFLYITPFLAEVDRICNACGFEQPVGEDDSEDGSRPKRSGKSDGRNKPSKSMSLKEHMKNGRSIATTHALFNLMDREALGFAREHHYSLMIDESVDVVNRQNISAGDFELITRYLTEEQPGGWLKWENAYSGQFSTYKALADSGRLVRIQDTLLDVMEPDKFRSFDDVFLMTYLFNGQYQRAYFDYFKIPYRIVGVECDDNGCRFSDKPDCPPPIDYNSLIHVVGMKRNKAIGDDYYAMSKSWYSKSGNAKSVAALRSGMNGFFRSCAKNGGGRLWTSFKDARHKLVDKKTHRYNEDFLQIRARAVNDYRDRTNLAYMANRFSDNRIIAFFNSNKDSEDEKTKMSQDAFALSEMLQWIWRGAIRDDKPINLYVPSTRMRNLLIGWIEDNRKGVVAVE